MPCVAAFSLWGGGPFRAPVGGGQPGRGEATFIGLMCGIPLLLVGVLATAVSLFDAPNDTIERLGAGTVGVMGLVFGVGFLVLALPGASQVCCGAGAAGWCRSRSCPSR